MEEMSDLISREALKEATKELYNKTLDAIVKFGIEKAYELINIAPTASPKQGEWIRKEDVIHSIAKQYSEHNELVPIWLSIGDMKGGAENG